MTRLKNLADPLRDPINLILIYIIVCGVAGARFIKISDQAKDIVLISFLSLTLLIYFIYVCRMKFSIYLRKVFAWPNQIILLYLFWSLATIGFAIDKTVTFFYVVGGLVVFLSGFVVTRVVVNRKNFKNILYSIFLASFASVAYAFLASIFGVSGSLLDPAFARVNLVFNSLTLYNAPFLSSYLEHPNTFGIALFFSIASSLTLFLLEKNKAVKLTLYLCSVLSLIALVLTFSRASILAISIFSVLIGYQAWRKGDYLIPVFSVIVVLLTAVFTTSDYQIFLIKKNPQQTAVDEMLVETGGTTVLNEISDNGDSEKPKSGRQVAKTGLSSREILWQSSLDYIRENPVVGAGLGNSEKAIATKIPVENKSLVGLTPHNTYLRIAVESGTLGLILYSVFVLYILKGFFSRFRFLNLIEFSALSVALSFMVLQIFEANFLLGTGFKSFYFLIFLASGSALISGRKGYENSHN